MKTKTKIKRVCVTPLSRKAKNRFSNNMDLLHTCTVEQEKNEQGINWLFLKALTREYWFWVPAKGNEDWIVD